MYDRTNQTTEKVKSNEKSNGSSGGNSIDLESNAITNAHVALEENQQKIAMVIENKRERERERKGY